MAWSVAESDQRPRSGQYRSAVLPDYIYAIGRLLDDARPGERRHDLTPAGLASRSWSEGGGDLTRLDQGMICQIDCSSVPGTNSFSDRAKKAR